MKFAQAAYVALAVLGIAAAVLVPLTIYRSGSSALPIWRTAASPGPLSNAHAFLDSQCEACHTPNRGIAAASCLTCHASDAPALAKQSTAFHAEIQECRGCHVEHQGITLRPTRMDHTVLARIGWQSTQGRRAPELPLDSDRSAMSEIQHFLAGVTGGHPANDTAALDCKACHSYRDRHRGLFGRECADCHETGVWKIAQYLHPSPRSQECAQCHQAPPSHYMMHFSMISMTVAGQMHARVEQCSLCHQTDSWNDIKGVGWYKHH